MAERIRLKSPGAIILMLLIFKGLWHESTSLPFAAASEALIVV